MSMTKPLPAVSAAPRSVSDPPGADIGLDAGSVDVIDIAFLELIK